MSSEGTGGWAAGSIRSKTNPQEKDDFKKRTEISTVAVPRKKLNEEAKYVKGETHVELLKRWARGRRKHLGLRGSRRNPLYQESRSQERKPEGVFRERASRRKRHDQVTEASASHQPLPGRRTYSQRIAS